jgi:hypothetical protein
LLDALVAESHLSDRQFKYEKYRATRGMPGMGSIDMRVTKSVTRYLDQLDDGTFTILDQGLQSLANNSQNEKWHLAHLRWFLGDLRLALIGEFPVFFTPSETGDRLFLYYIGLRRWATPVRNE